MKINRRDFLKWSATTAATTLTLSFDTKRLNELMAAENDPPVIWLQGASCSGCSISTLNVTVPTTIDDVLLNSISMKFHPNLSTLSGNQAMQAIDTAAKQYQGQFILVIEGAIHTGNYKNYCVAGRLNGVNLTMYDAVMRYGTTAKYVVAAGTCASFGGVAKAGVNAATCAPVRTVLTGKTLNPVVNLPGCPVHPTILVQSLLNLILTGAPVLDTYGRPTKYYSRTVHSACPRREAPDAAGIGRPGCYEEFGCMGPGTNAPCPSIKWNNGVNWCVQSNYPCIGCAQPGFPTNPLLSRHDD